MKPSVYIETSIVSVLASRPSNNVGSRMKQELTRRWWRERRGAFKLVASSAVIVEASRGDPVAAARRLRLLEEVESVPVEPEAAELAIRLLNRLRLPQKAAVDAVHVASAACQGTEFLMTWNCRHIANATLWSRIESTCRDAGVRSPVICTPQELLWDPWT